MFPLTFYFALLITVYTMVILGGPGSMPGVVLGAMIISALLELLRDPGKSSASSSSPRSSAGRSVAFRFSKKLAIVAAVDARLRLCGARDPRARPTRGVGRGREAPAAASAVAHWVVVPAHLTAAAPVDATSG